MRVRTAWLVFIVGLWVSPGAAGADMGPDLREGDRAMDSLDYARAVQAFERVTASREAAPDELVRAYSALVRCQVVLGDEGAARLAAEQLLELDPGAQLEGGSIPPRVTRFFEDFRREYSRTSEAVVTVTLPDEIPAGRSMLVTARVRRGGRGVAAVRVHFSFGPEEPAVAVDLERRERSWSGRVEVPATYDASMRSLRYWVEAIAPSGAVVGGLGNADEPMVIAPTRRSSRAEGGEGEGEVELVTPAEQTRIDRRTRERNEEFFRQRYAITSQWWFWTGIVAVAAGGALAVVFIATDEGEKARIAPEGGVWPLP